MACPSSVTSSRCGTSLRCIVPSPESKVPSPESKVPSPAADSGLWTRDSALIRHRARVGELTGNTAGLALGYVQANLVVVPRDLAFDFLLFCQRNPKPCPLLDVTEPGDPEPKLVAPGADLRTDLPRYRVYRNGELVEEPTDLCRWWRDDLVGFLLGCSFTFENALLQAGLPLRHLEMGRNVPMYRTNIPCRPAGVFRGPMVVSMRPMTPAQAIQATRICSRFRAPTERPSTSATRRPSASATSTGRISAMRWTFVPAKCRSSGRAASPRKRWRWKTRPPLLMTHKPGHMFVTDWRDTDLEGE